LTAEALRELRSEKDAQLARQQAEIQALTGEITDLRGRLQRLEALLAGQER
jgi:polyhydroxyalkanoate synthesis regulator phasin